MKYRLLSLTLLALTLHALHAAQPAGAPRINFDTTGTNTTYGRFGTAPTATSTSFNFLGTVTVTNALYVNTTNITGAIAAATVWENSGDYFNLIAYPDAFQIAFDGSLYNGDQNTYTYWAGTNMALVSVRTNANGFYVAVDDGTTLSDLYYVASTNISNFTVALDTGTEAYDTQVAATRNGSYVRLRKDGNNYALIDPWEANTSPIFHMNSGAAHGSGNFALFENDGADLFALDYAGNLALAGYLSLSGTTNRLSDDGAQLLYNGQPLANANNTYTTNLYVTNSSTIYVNGIDVRKKEIGVACSDLTTALTTGTIKAYFRMPYRMTLTSVRASLLTAQTSGSIFTVNVEEGGTTVLSTAITIDNGEKTSTTAATPPVISDSNLANDAEITIDIDQVGDGTAKGLIVWLIGNEIP